MAGRYKPLGYLNIELTKRLLGPARRYVWCFLACRMVNSPLIRVIHTTVDMRDIYDFNSFFKPEEKSAG